MKARKRDGDLEQVWVAKTEVKQEAPSRPPGKLEQLSGPTARISQDRAPGGGYAKGEIWTSRS